MYMSTPKVLSVQSHTVHGYVGNKAATFPLQTLGFNVDCINTITLSNEPGYAGGFKGQTMTGDNLHVIVEGLKDNQLLNHDIMLTGYTRTSELLDEIVSTVKMLRSNNPSVIYVCDPVMGDNGKFYVPEELCDKYKHQILPLASVITPNMFEAQALSGVMINTLADAVAACKVLVNLGPKIVVLTGLNLLTTTTDDANSGGSGPHHLSVLLAYKNQASLSSLAGTISSASSDNSASASTVATADGSSSDEIHIYRLDVPAIDNTFSGCGDLFSALLAAGLYRCQSQLAASPHLLASVLEVVTHAMTAVLTRTKHAQTDEKLSRELRIVESSDVFRAVGDEYTALLSSNTTQHLLTMPQSQKRAQSYVAASSAVSGVIFDMDGTLTEAGAIDFGAMYTRTGLTRSKSSDILTLVNALPSQEERDNAMNIILEEEMLGIERMVIRAQLHAFLHALKKSRLRIALSTRNCAHAVDRFIEVSEIHNDTFHPLLSRDSLGGVNKPSPEVAQHVFRSWNIQPGYESSVWFVGDSVDDMQCGKRAGCKTCLIRTPHNKDLPLATRENELVDVVVDSLEEFAKIINIAL